MLTSSQSVNVYVAVHAGVTESGLSSEGGGVHLKKGKCMPFVLLRLNPLTLFTFVYTLTTKIAKSLQLETE